MRENNIIITAKVSGKYDYYIIILCAAVYRGIKSRKQMHLAGTSSHAIVQLNFRRRRKNTPRPPMLARAVQLMQSSKTSDYEFYPPYRFDRPIRTVMIHIINFQRSSVANQMQPARRQ